MRLRIIWIGKTRETHLRALTEGYLERLGHFVRCDVAELPDSGTGARGIERESRRISEASRSANVTVLLDPAGAEWTSTELAARMQRWQNSGIREVAFVIGGPFGVTTELAGGMNERWCLSRLTLTHEMSRVLLCEQLYRAYTIIQGLPYQK
jgi:23S rRNA (pseudouridine1915-N3)-methyltransferase